MIARDDDDRVVQLPDFFERRHRALDHFVKMFHLDEVIQNVTAYDVVVRKDRRHDDLCRILAAAFAHPRLEGAVRFMCAQPKTKRLARLHLGKEVVKIRRVVPPGDGLKDRDQSAVVELTAGRVGRAATGLQASRTPPFAGETNRIADFSQFLRVRGKFRRQSAVNVARLLESPDVLTGENGATRRAAGGSIAKRVHKPKPLPRHSVKRRRLDHRVAVGTGVGIRLVIGNAEQDVRPGVLRSFRQSGQ